MIPILYALWCGLCWRLRGGALNQLTSMVGIHVGTGITRIVTSALIVAPLTYFQWHLAAMWPFVFAAMTLPYFDKSMGLEEKGRDHFYLALWGVAVAAICIAPLAWYNPWVLLNSLGGILFMVAYAANKPLGGNWTERAECCVGFLLGLLLWVSLHG
jgi:hypothetical protein